ncbi:MAG: PASTA domain-containing protein [Candidatus Acidiferrales bacterium]|jgi:beta-lactam-binding protein with PASTA domain
MTLGERLEWLMRMSLLAFILACAAFLSAITAMRFAIHGREVTMPNLVGKSAADATQMLQSRGLLLRVADRVYSDLSLNVVVRQTPPAGMLMKVSQQAHVVLSLGQRQISIPSLEGKTLRVSRIELLRSGLQIGEISNLHLADAPVDAVILQNPRSGSNAPSPRVDLLVSQGVAEQSYVMPALVGLNEAEAGRRLDPAGLRRKTDYVPATEWPHGAVIDQAPAAGSRVSQSATVAIKVAE